MTTPSSDQMEALIDLNAKPVVDHGSLLRRRSASHDEMTDAAIKGGLIGAGVALALAVLAFLLTIGEHGSEGAFAAQFWGVSAIIVGLAAMVGASVVRQRILTECRDGFLRIDMQNVQYWTSTQVVLISVDRLFGAGVEGLGPGERLRLCCVAEVSSGFESLTRNFRMYEMVEGPLVDTNSGEWSGNALAKQAILYYIDQRRAASMPVAQLPPYGFISVKQHLEFLFFGKRIVDNVFNCDGKTLTWVSPEGKVAIPVTDVEEVSVDKVQGKNGPTKWVLTLLLDSESGRDTFKLDILSMTYADELEKYCRCLPTLFETV